MENLFKIKKLMQKRLPRFVRDEFGKRKEVGSSWRRPRGNCSKIRKAYGGHASRVKAGFRTPRLIRGMLHSMLEPVHTSTLAQVAKLDGKKHTAVLGRTLGMHKKVMLIESLMKKNVKIYNYSEPQKFLDEVKKKMADRKKNRKASPTPASVDKKAAKPQPKKEEVKEPLSKTETKKELDKVLTQKQ